VSVMRVRLQLSRKGLGQSGTLLHLIYNHSLSMFVGNNPNFIYEGNILGAVNLFLLESCRQVYIHPDKKMSITTLLFLKLKFRGAYVYSLVA